MKPSLVLFFAAILTSAVHAGPNDMIRNYPVVKVAPDTYVIHGPLGEPSVANQGFMNNPG